jgi:hypothetical protein
MVLELGDIAKVSNDNTNVHCDVEFKTKGFFSGTYNAISGKVKSPKGELGEISGKWSDQMYIQRKVCWRTRRRLGPQLNGTN